MATNKRLEDLTAAAALTATDLTIIGQGTNAFKAALSALKTFFSAITATGSLTERSLQDRAADVFNVKDYGAKGDGVITDNVAINAADAAAATNGGTVFYPPGTYLVDHNELVGTSQQRACINVSSFVWHVGSGTGATIIKVKDSADSSPFVFHNTVDSGVFNLQIDGNRANQTEGNGNASPTGTDPHGIKAFQNVTRLTLHNLYIHDMHDYGIGIQALTAKDCDIGHIKIERSGADGIDCKNEDDASEGNRIHNITIDTINLQTGPPAGGQQAGVNTRAGWKLTNIEVINLVGNEVGVRFNSGELTQSGGLSRRQSLTNFFIQATTSSTTIGIMADSVEATYSNGVIVNVNNGIQVRQRENVFSNIVIDGVGNDGLNLVSNTPSFLTEPVRNIFNNIMVRNAADAAIQMDGNSDQNHFVNIVGRSCDRGIVVGSGATDNQFIGGGLTAITTTLVADSGTGTVFRNVGGITNENSILSPTFLIDSAATVTVTVAHGLDFTPADKDVQVIIVEASAVDDWAVDHLKIVSTDGTNITFKVVIGTASATGSANARLAVRVGVRN